jgi:hypothetical protein
MHDTRAWGQCGQSHERGGVDLEPRGLERLTIGQVRGDRAEDVAPVKCGGDGREPPRRVGDVARLDRVVGGGEEETVVGADEDPVGCPEGDGAPRGPDSGVDDGEVDAGRRERDRSREPA